MGAYAANTEVGSERTKLEIERTLVRFGARRFQYGWDEHEAVIMFELQNRRVLFRLTMPDRQGRDVKYTPARGQLRSQAAQEEAYEQLIRQRWRVLALGIKAKLAMVESGITSFEKEFLAHVVLPDGSTVGDWAAPAIAEAYERGSVPALTAGGAR